MFHKSYLLAQIESNQSDVRFVYNALFTTFCSWLFVHGFLSESLFTTFYLQRFVGKRGLSKRCNLPVPVLYWGESRKAGKQESRKAEMRVSLKKVP